LKLARLLTIVVLLITVRSTYTFLITVVFTFTTAVLYWNTPPDQRPP
jgi:hypothetical protein